MKALWLALFCLCLVIADKDCLEIPLIGKACVEIQTEDCFNLNVGASLEPTVGEPIKLPTQRIPLGTMLQTAQLLKNLGQKLNYCQKFTTSCSACVEVTELNVQPSNGKLHLCAKPAINCSAIQNIPAFPTNPRCIDINGCNIFACLNNCSKQGTCGPLGCKCEEGYTGVDCSISSQDNCLINANRPEDKVCWTPKNPTACSDKLSLEVTAPWVKTATTVEFELKDKTLATQTLPVLPCLAGGNPAPQVALLNNCTLCVDVKSLNFSTERFHVVTGCPVVKLNCAGRDLRADQLPCGEILRSPFLAEQCQAAPSSDVEPPTVAGPPPHAPRAPAAPRTYEPEPEDETKYSPSTMYVAAVVVGVFIFAIAGGGYFAWMHYKDKQSAGRIDENELSVSLSVSSNSDEDGFLPADGSDLNINDSGSSLSD